MNNGNAVSHNVVLVTDGSADGLFDQVRKKHRSAFEESSTEALRHVAFFRYGVNPELSYSGARSIHFESQAREADLDFLVTLMGSAGTTAKVHFLMADAQLDPGAVNIAFSQGSDMHTLTGYVASDGASHERYLEVLAHVLYDDDLRRCIDERVSTGYYRGVGADWDRMFGRYASAEKVDEFKRGIGRIVLDIRWRVDGWNDINSPLRLAFGADFAGNQDYPWILPPLQKQPATDERFYLATTWEEAAALSSAIIDRKIPTLCDCDGDWYLSGYQLHAAGLIDDAGKVTCTIPDSERGSNDVYMIYGLTTYADVLAQAFGKVHDLEQMRAFANRRRKAIDWLEANGIEQPSPNMLSQRAADNPTAASVETLAMTAGFTVDVQDVAVPIRTVVDGMDVEIYHDKDAFDRAVDAVEADERRIQ